MLGPAPEAGGRLGPYVLVRRLGAGGGGEVWEAVLHGPAGFHKPVALKILREGPPDEAARDALVREARLGALVQHPNLVSTLALGEHGGRWCVALELVRGLTVAELCRRAGGRLPAPAVVDVGVQAAQALDHLHGFRAEGRVGLVHRDVKPANLLVDRTGLVKLADFGISLSFGEQGAVAGTPGWCAPEQLLGHPEPRSDLFALGAVLYLLVTGARPFGPAPGPRQVLGVEALLARADYLAPVELAVPGLAAIVHSCLRYDPAGRPGSARLLAERLSGLRPALAPGRGVLELLARAMPELEIPTVATPVSQEPTRLLPGGNLIPARNAFVGRGGELQELQALLHGTRWVVVCGPGGMGKTRLALEVARRVRGDLPGGAWAFDLSAARSVAEMTGAVASALQIELERQDPVGQLGRVFAGMGRVLLLLDNLEQCVGALPETVGRWLGQAPEATWLATSRVVPGLLGERVLSLGELGLSESEALFCDRAPRALTEAERTEVRDLCVALEGMPLAIELAAARLRVIDVGAIRSRLSLALLTGGGRELPERHRSMAASLRWSFDLLPPAVREAFAQVAVFEGSFALEAAEAVVDLRGKGGSLWALDALQELCDASLLQVDAAQGRFRMRVVVREFAAEHLSREERARAEARHGAYYAQLGSPVAIDALTGPGGVERLVRLGRELDELTASCRRAVHAGEGATAVAALCAADQVLVHRGPHRVRVDLVRAVIGLPELSQADRARALAVAGDALGGTEALCCAEEAIALWRALGDRRSAARATASVGALQVRQGRTELGWAYLEAALAVHREIGDRRSEGGALGQLGVLHLQQGRTEPALAHLEAALAVARDVGNRRSEGGVLGHLGILYMQQGRTEEARAHFCAALEVHREVGNRRAEGSELGNLGILEYQEGRMEARAHHEAALAVAREVGDRRFEGVVLCNVGILDHTQGRTEDARTHFEASLAVHREVGNPRSEGFVLYALGNLHREEGRTSDARSHYEAALAVARRVGDRRTGALVLASQARLAAVAREWDRAAAALTEAEQHAAEVREPDTRGMLLVARAEVAARRGHAEAAASLLGAAEAAAAGRADLRREVGLVRALLVAPPSSDAGAP